MIGLMCEQLNDLATEKGEEKKCQELNLCPNQINHRLQEQRVIGDSVIPRILYISRNEK